MFNRVTTFTGESIIYDAVEHRYATVLGEPLLSGSQYAKRFEEPFDKERWLPHTAAKLHVDESVVEAAWELRGEISRSFGEAIHKAMDGWFKYRDIGYGVPKHPFLKQCVETFPESEARVLSEVMVSDVARSMAGQIDGLTILGEKHGQIIDYKSDAGIRKNLQKHFNQLSFYAHILIAHGWKIDSVTVWNYTEHWTPWESSVLPLAL